MGSRIRTAIVILLLLLTTAPAKAQSPSAYSIHIDVEAKKLTLFKGEQMIRTYAIATGAWETPTPLGVFIINRRFSGNMCGFGTCFLGLNVPWGNYGIHGTDKPESIGSSASHGCIRMTVRDAEELYALVPNGTQVVIEYGPYGDLGYTLRPLKNGDRNSSVRALQSRLKALGFYPGWPDGIFGEATQHAVDKARSVYGLSANGKADWALYQALGISLFE